MEAADEGDGAGVVQMEGQEQIEGEEQEVGITTKN